MARIALVAVLAASGWGQGCREESASDAGTTGDADASSDTRRQDVDGLDGTDAEEPDTGSVDLAVDSTEDLDATTDGGDAASDVGADSDGEGDALTDVSAEPDLTEEGELCTGGVDEDGDGRVDCHDPDCFDRPACEGVPPAPWVEPRRWRSTWSDEFNGPEPGNEDCFDNTVTPPQCLTLYWHNEDCPERALDGLADLNKCNWSVFYLYNWMDWGKPLGEGVNAFDPEMVAVTGGELVLRAEGVLPEGGLPAGWSMSRVLDEYDCGNPPDTGYEISKDCPIISGGLWSKQMGTVAGLLQTYGRFEIRARLPVGPGSWPAHWMLPQDGPWPGDGEIDIMEATNHQPNFTPHEVAANFHDGVDVEIDGETVSTHMSVGSMSQDMSIAQQTDEYHVFSVEWDAEHLRFYVDDHLIGTVVEGTLLPNDDLETGDYVGDYPLEVPDELFHLILNSTVAAFDDDDYPDPRGFEPQTHHIDYVRAFEPCVMPDDACPDLGSWDGSACRIGDVPDRADLFLRGTDLVYPAEAGAEGCPDGGVREGDLCAVFTSPQGAVSFLREGGFFIESPCRINTLPNGGRCQAPCGGLGELQGDRCLVGSPPEGTRGMIRDDTFVYSISDGPERCPVGRDRGIWCEFGEIPEGRTGWVPFDADAFYLDAVCAPAAYMPNCTEPCPAGARWDGERCLVVQAPPGRNAFVWEGGFYYDYLDTEVYATRCPIGSDDSVHCYLGPAPGPSPQLDGDTFYVAAACGAVPALPE